MQDVNKAYDDAVASGLLPGYSLTAADREGKLIVASRICLFLFPALHRAGPIIPGNGRQKKTPSMFENDSANTFCRGTGNVIYSRSSGRASLRENDERPFTSSTVCAIASMTKLVTSVAVLQAVEDGILDLDADVRPLVPRMGEHGVITGFDGDEKPELTPDDSPVSLRMLLTHTSGHEYDWFNPLLGRWRASRGEEPFTGPTVEHKSALPLVFAPGTSFAYGAGHDWAGRLVELAAGTSLDDFMRRRIFAPLGLRDGDVGFYPDKNGDMRDRMAGIATLDAATGAPPAADAPAFDILFGATECLGGAGLFATSAAYQAFLCALLRRDPVLLQPASYAELFRPQLDGALEEALNDYVSASPVHAQLFGLGIPAGARKNWSLAGLVAAEALEGRCGAGASMWAGVCSTVWFVDHEVGVCGTALCQVIPPLHPSVMSLHEKFQRGVLAEITGKESYKLPN